MSTPKPSPADAFWDRETKEILAGPRDDLKEQVRVYYDLTRDEDLEQIRRLIRATEHAKDLVGELEIELIKERLDELEENASPSFFEVAVGLALGGAGGLIASAVLKKVVGRMLRSRLLMVTTVSKVRLPLDAATPANLAKLEAIGKKHGRRIKQRKHFYKLTSPPQEVNLDPDSWESVLLSVAPDFVSEVAVGTLQEGSASRAKKSSHQRLADFFLDRISELEGQILPVQKSYGNLWLSMAPALGPGASGDEAAQVRRDLVSTIKENRRFAQLNELATNRKLSRQDELRVLAQPVFTAAVAMSYAVPAEVLEASPARTEYDIIEIGLGTRTKAIEISALPRRPKTSSAEERLLVRLSQRLYVPAEFQTGRLVTMHEAFHHQPQRPQLEVVLYFNDYRLEQYRPTFDSIRDYVRSLGTGGGPPTD